MSHSQATEANLQMVDAMVKGGMTLDQIAETINESSNEGLCLAVRQRREEAARSAHQTPQPSGCVRDSGDTAGGPPRPMISRSLATLLT